MSVVGRPLYECRYSRQLSPPFKRRFHVQEPFELWCSVNSRYSDEFRITSGFNDCARILVRSLRKASHEAQDCGGSQSTEESEAGREIAEKGHEVNRRQRFADCSQVLPCQKEVAIQTGRTVRLRWQTASQRGQHHETAETCANPFKSRDDALFNIAPKCRTPMEQSWLIRAAKISAGWLTPLTSIAPVLAGSTWASSPQFLARANGDRGLAAAF
jgi:hypothetical protein